MSIRPSGPGEDVIFTGPGLSQDLRPLVRARRKAGFLTCRRSQFLRAGRVAGNAWRRAAAMANAVAVNRDVAQDRAPAPVLSRMRPPAREPAAMRSEERRVGKECRSRWSRY